MKDNKSYATRLTAIAASIPCVAVSAAARAELVTIDDRPEIMSLVCCVNWDIDGNGSSDAVISPNGRTMSFLDNSSYTYSSVVGSVRKRKSSLAGGKLFPIVFKGIDHGFYFFNDNKNDNNIKIDASVNINPDFSDPYSFSLQSILLARARPYLTAYRTVSYSTLNGSTIGSAYGTRNNTGIYSIGIQEGDNYFAFRFSGENSSTPDLYGWGILSFEVGEENGMSGGRLLNSFITISEWTYNNTPGTPVHVGTRASEIPEPASTLSTIALLGLGAAGVRSWRKRSTGGDSNHQTCRAME